MDAGLGSVSEASVLNDTAWSRKSAEELQHPAIAAQLANWSSRKRAQRATSQVAVSPPSTSPPSQSSSPQAGSTVLLTPPPTLSMEAVTYSTSEAAKQHPAIAAQLAALSRRQNKLSSSHPVEDSQRSICFSGQSPPPHFKSSASSISPPEFSVDPLTLANPFLQQSVLSEDLVETTLAFTRHSVSPLGTGLEKSGLSLSLGGSSSKQPALVPPTDALPDYHSSWVLDRNPVAESVSKLE